MKQCSWGFSGVPSRKSSLLSCVMCNTELLCTQCRGIGPLLAARGKSHGFSRVAAGTWGIFSSYHGDGPSTHVFVQRRQDSCLVARDNSRFYSRTWQGKWDASPAEAGDQGSLSTCHSNPGTPINFHEESGIVSFGGTDLRVPLEFSKDVRPPVAMRWGTRSFSVVSTGDSDILSSWEMQDEPAFKSLQAYPALFRVRASRCPFHLRPQTQGPSHIPRAERSLLLRCLW